MLAEAKSYSRKVSKATIGKTNGRDTNHFCTVPEAHSIAPDGEPRGFADRSDPQRQPTVAIDVKLTSRIVTGFN